jgi:osmotically-inducible protein OsmY
MALWSYPDERYYYAWYEGEDIRDREPPAGGPPIDAASDREIKARLVERLRDDPFTADGQIKVDVKQRVVILGGQVASSLAKRVAGDDAWDTPGVVDVSNQLQVVGDVPPPLPRSPIL